VLFILGLVTGLVLSGFFYGLIWLAIDEASRGSGPSASKKEDPFKTYEEYCKPQIVSGE